MVHFSIDPRLKANASLHSCLVEGNKRLRHYLDGRPVYPLIIQWEAAEDSTESSIVKLRFSAKGDLYETNYPAEDLDDAEHAYWRLFLAWGALLKRKSLRLMEAARAELDDKSTAFGS